MSSVQQSLFFSLVIALTALTGACSEAKSPGRIDGSQPTDVGLVFRDQPVSPPADQGTPFEQGPPTEQGTPAEQGAPTDKGTPPPPDAGAPSPCPTDWSKWNCIDKALLGCTASCGGTQYKLACNALGQCTCDVAGVKKTCPGMPLFPPPVPGCSFCSISLAAQCCESPTP